MCQLARAATRRYVAALSPVGLNVRQISALKTLERDGAMSQQALGEALDIDPSNLVALLNHLEEQGLATRRRDPEDRRRHVVELSKHGTKRVTDVNRRAREVDAGFFGGLDDAERAQLYALLARVGETADLPEGMRLDRPDDDMLDQ